jgi:hypothetical protein
MKQRCTIFLAAFSAALALSAQVTAANSAEIKVLGAVAMQTALNELAQAFESTTSHKVTISYATAGVLNNRIQGGEFADMTVLPRPVFEALVTEEKSFPEVQAYLRSRPLECPYAPARPSLTLARSRRSSDHCWRPNQLSMQIRRRAPQAGFTSHASLSVWELLRK